MVAIYKLEINLKILLAISSSISAYKTPQLVRMLKKDGHEVICLVTKNAEKLVSTKALQTVSENIVITDMWKSVNTLEHIDINNKTDVLLIAPATFNIIGKIANGIADCYLSTVASAYKGRKLIAPAMNPHMWNNKVLQKNLEYLKTELGYGVIYPEKGKVACGDEGIGRLASLESIVSSLELGTSFKNIRFAVTSGPTREWIDPIRYITNNSSGKMGHAIYEEIVSNGGHCTYIEGGVKEPLINYSEFNTKKIKIETTSQLKEEVLKVADNVDILIMAAAPLDFRPVSISDKKIKKENINSIELSTTGDILKELGERKRDNLVVVAFAAETASTDEELEKLAIEKMISKNANMIVANKILDAVGQNTNKISIFRRDGFKCKYDVMSKHECAKVIVKMALDILAKNG